MLRFIPKDRNYNEWEIENNTTDTLCLDPIKNKLLPGDIINTDGIMLSSPYMERNEIPGILLTSGKTYGRPETNKQNIPHNKNKKLFYKCVPYDKTLPCLLIPYEYKLSGFSKKKSDMYVLFKIKNWKNKHPEGILQKTIGCVDIPEYFYDYQLYCNNLMISANKFNKKVLSMASNLDVDEVIVNYMKTYDNVEDRRDENIFSIDPSNTKDIDDAISFKEYSESYIVSIYIANVPAWLSIFSLWEQLTSRTSTIYLPTVKLPLFPFILSENILSLLEHKTRLAFAMDVYISKSENTVCKIEYKNTVIHLKNNFTYEEPNLLRRNDYKRLLSLTKSLNTNTQYIYDIDDSHTVVEFWMIFMNHRSGEYLQKVKKGIFRSVCTNSKIVVDTEYKELNKFLNMWKYTTSEYSLVDNQKGHHLIGPGIQAYTQITSPIRRLVDIVNMTYIQSELKLICLCEKTNKYLEHWLSNLSDINEKSRKIRKVQNNCALFNKCLEQNHENNNLIGFVLSKKDNNASKDITYEIYIQSLSIVSKVVTNKILTLYEKYHFNLHIFCDENTLHRKIRLHLSDKTN